MSAHLKVFFISMLPIIELRGAIPVATALGITPQIAYAICIIGNMLPVPFIFLFAKKVLLWGKAKPYLGKPFSYILDKGYRSGKKFEDKAGPGLYIALALFVGIPLPGTGAWTGSLAASLLGMHIGKSVISVLAGVLISGAIMISASFGVLSIFT